MAYVLLYQANIHTTYYPLCHICGNEVSSMNYLRNVKYTCKDCKLERIE